MAVVFTLITSFCGFRKRNKNASSPAKVSTASIEMPDTDARLSPQLSSVQGNPDGSRNNTSNKELPLPPAMKASRGTHSCNNDAIAKSTSIRMLRYSLSVKLPRTLSMRKKGQDKEDDKPVEKKKKSTKENSILINPIILGEKCRVSGTNEEEENVLYDVDGKKIRIYHPRSMSSISLSRSLSRIDPKSIPGHDIEMERTKNKNDDRS